jgi:phosphoglycolate phosphatase
VTTAPSWPEAILFDLDGTLIDSAADIHIAVNTAMAADGHAPFTLADVRSFIGNGIAMLVRRAYAARNVTLDGEALRLKTEEVAELYEARNSASTTLMPGAVEMLARYRDAGVKLAIVTNKLQDTTHAVLAHFDLARFFDVVVGDRDLPRKPEPDMLLHALSELGVRPGRAVMVGDSPADVGAARAARVPSLVLADGYSTTPVETLGAGAVIASLWELPQGIEKLLVAAAAE